jgi:hypothetical protein
MSAATTPKRRTYIAPSVGQPWRPHRELRPPHRDRGCPGMLRYSDTQHAVPLTECDVCGYEIGVGR